MSLPELGAWLRHHRDAGERLTLDRSEVAGLNDELQRLRQSNDRMRKQNAKLRKRIDRLKAGEADPGEADGSPGADATDPAAS